MTIEHLNFRAMRNSVKRTLVAGVMSLSLIGMTNLVWAAGPKEKNESRAVQKAREMVEESAYHDWKTLAKAAERCIVIDKNLKEAYDWLSKSIDLNEAVYNLTVLGDYYLKNDLPVKAMNTYLKALGKGRSEIEDFDGRELESKVWVVRNIIYP